MRIKFCKVQFLAWPLGENWIFRLPCFSVALVFFFFIIALYRFVIWKARKKPVIFSRNENGNIQWKIRCCSWIACLWYEATRCGQKSRGKLRKRNIYQRHAIFGSWINWLFAHVGAEPMERNYQPDKILMMSGRANHGLLTQLLPEERQDGCVWFTKIACTSARSIDQRIDDKRAEW